MKLIRIIKNNISIIIKNKIFWISVIITTVLCFTSTLYSDAYNKQYSVFQVLLDFDKNWCLSDISYSSFYVILSSRASKLSMFIPIIASFTFIQSICDEKRSKFKRVAIIRTGKNKYYVGKIFSALISGGLVVSLGYILFSICIYFLFPSINEYFNDILATELSDILNNNTIIVHYMYKWLGYIGLYIISLIGMFIYGAFSVALTVLLLSITSNKYLLSCIPFIIKYIFDMWTNKTLISMWSGNNVNCISKWLSENCRLESIYYAFTDNFNISGLIFYLILLFLSSFIYLYAENRRLDYGE